MKRKSLLWSLTAATVMLFASCDNENIQSDVDNGKPATVNISIVSTKSSETTQPASDDENKISHFEAYAFKSTGENISYVKVENGVKTTTLLAEVGNVTIAVVANSAIGTVSTLSDLKNKLSTHEFTKNPNNTTFVPKNEGATTFGFVMTAHKTLTLTEGSNSASISLKRTVSKFEEPNCNSTLLDLQNVDKEKLEEIFTGFDGDKTKITFSYESFVLANGLDKSLLFNDADYDGNDWPSTRTNWISNYPTVTTSTLTYLNSVFDETEGTKGQYIENGVYSKEFAKIPVYVHENFPYADYDFGSVKGYNPKEVYCFIVKGKLKYEEQEKTRYWRINLVKSTTGDPTNDYYRIFRNGLYKVTVDKVNTIGYGTPKEAEEEVPVIPIENQASVNITVDSAPWDVYVSNTSM